MIKQKICAGCNELSYIYKNIDGKKYCKSCTFKLQPSKSIQPYSKRRKEQQKLYSEQIKVFKEKNNCCIARVSPECTGCDAKYITISHTKGRIEDLLLDEKYWQPICFFCHQWITEHPKEAKELGLELSRLNKS